MFLYKLVTAEWLPVLDCSRNWLRQFFVTVCDLVLFAPLLSTGPCSLWSSQPHPMSSRCYPAPLSLSVSMIVLVFPVSFYLKGSTPWPFWWCSHCPSSSNGQSISISLALLWLLPLLVQFVPTVPHSWWHLAKRMYLAELSLTVICLKMYNFNPQAACSKQSGMHWSCCFT